MSRKLEEDVKVVLTGMLKLSLCGLVGMVVIALLTGQPVSATLWAASCAGALSYRWVGRIFKIEPNSRKADRKAQSARRNKSWESIRKV